MRSRSKSLATTYVSCLVYSEISDVPMSCPLPVNFTQANDNRWLYTWYVDILISRRYGTNTPRAVTLNQRGCGLTQIPNSAAVRFPGLIPLIMGLAYFSFH